MEDQGKRLLLAVAIAFGIMLLWQIIFPSKKPDPEQGKENGAETTEVVDGKDSGASQAKDSQGKPEDKPDEPEPETPPSVERGEEDLYTVESDLFRVVFTSWGGAVKSYQLLGDQYVDKEVGGPLDLVRTTEAEGLPLSVHFEDSTYDIPAGAVWKGEQVKDNEIKFTWESSELRVEKFFRVHPEDFLVEMVVKTTKLAGEEAKQSLVISLFGYEDPKAETEQSMSSMPRAWTAGCLLDDDVKQYSAKKVMKKERTQHGAVRWGGLIHTYFLVALAIDSEIDPTMTCRIRALERPGAMRVDMTYPKVTIKDSGDVLVREAVAYLGPKYLNKLENVDRTVELESPGFEEAIDFGWFGVISRPLLWLLTLIQGLVVNWGVAIILLTFVVKAATLYWTHKSMKSMRAMSKLKPKLDALKEKYGDDKESLNRETMNLFKTHGVNPLSGCLPMLLQMPIWFALYRMLMAVAELYQAPFIPGWIDDLTLPDPIYVLPVLLTGMMFVQSKLTPVTQSGLQQKLIQYGMPIMFGVFSFFFPAGLTLYIFTNVCLTAAHHLVIHREGREEARAANKSAAKKPAKQSEPEPDVEINNTEGDSEGDEESGETSASESVSKKGTEDKAQGEEARRSTKRSKGSRGKGKRKRSKRAKR